MKGLILLFILTLSTLSFSQDNYWFGYEQGFRNGCNCTNSLPNNNHLFKKGTYELGYKEGLLEGRLFRIENTNQNQQQRENIYKDPAKFTFETDYMYQGMALKQQLLNSRRAEMQAMYENFYEIATLKVNQLGKNWTQQNTNYIKEVGDLLTKYSSYDLSVDNTWYQIKNFYSQHKNTILNW